MNNYFIHIKASPHKFLTLLVLLFFLFIGPLPVLADYEDGLLASRKGDYITAFREFRSLAENGHAKSQRQLGIMFEMGLGIKKDYSEAEKWFQKAAIQGDTEAQNRLIDMRKRIITNTYPPPVPDGYQGNTTDPQVQYDLGVMYFKGVNVKSDPVTAYRWFKMAANQGHARAQNDLAVILASGIGMRQNSSEAYIWFMKAAEQGFADAQFNLGIMLSQGKRKDMSRHLLLAYMWFEIAGQNGILEARNSQVRLAKQLQEEQIKEAKIQAQKWLLKYGSNK
jgi:TPR repeat protein